MIGTIGWIIYLYNNFEWVEYSISQLGTAPETVVPFTFVLIIASVFGMSYGVLSVVFFGKTSLMRRPYTRVQFLYVITALLFVIAHLALIGAAVVPKHIHLEIHSLAAMIYFACYGAAIFLFSCVVDNPQSEFSRFSRILSILFLAGSGTFWMTTGRGLPSEAFGMILLWLWNAVLLRQILRKERDNISVGSDIHKRATQLSEEMVVLEG